MESFGFILFFTKIIINNIISAKRGCKLYFIVSKLLELEFILAERRPAMHVLWIQRIAQLVLKRNLACLFSVF